MLYVRSHFSSLSHLVITCTSITNQHGLPDLAAINWRRPLGETPAVSPIETLGIPNITMLLSDWKETHTYVRSARHITLQIHRVTPIRPTQRRFRDRIMSPYRWKQSTPRPIACIISLRFCSFIFVDVSYRFCFQDGFDSLLAMVCYLWFCLVLSKRKRRLTQP